MIEEKIINEIVHRIRDYSSPIKFGTVSVSLKFHEGNCVAISHEITETTKHKELIYGDNK